MTTSTSRRSCGDPSLTIPTALGSARVVTSSRAEGDFNLDRVPREDLLDRRRALVDLPWTMLAEQHGTDVVDVRWPGDGDGASGDVLVTSAAGAVLGVWVGDCAPVVLVAESGRLAAVHAGWRGLASGVLDVAVAALHGPTHAASEDQPGVTVRAVLGPCIGPCCYEFGPRDLAAVAAGIGTEPETITARDRLGRRSLDVPAAVRIGLARHGIALAPGSVCTGCDDRYFSHRARGEAERHVVAVWRPVI